MSVSQNNMRNIQKVPMVKRLMLNNSTYLLLGLIVYIVLVSIIAPNFASPYNFSIVMEQLAVPGIMAVGMCMVMISGGIDLSVGAQLSFGACLMAFFIKDSTVGPVPGILIGAAAIILGSFIMGILISRMSMEPFIVSLGFMVIYKGLALITTNGAEFPIPNTMGFATSIRLFNLPLMVFVMLFVFILFVLIFRFTRFGRWLYAVGDNPEAAFLSGINVNNFKVLVYTINGALVAVATILMLSRNEVGNPYLGTDLEMRAIASAVIGGTALAGGRGNIIGTLLGAIWMGIISNSLNIIGVSAFYQYVVTGCIIIVAVLANNVRRKG